MSTAQRSRTHWTRRVTVAVATMGLVGLAACGDQKSDNTQSAERVVNPGDTDAPLSTDAPLDEALAHRDPLQRVQRVAQILEQATPDQLETIKSAIERAPLAWGDLEYVLFAGWWARFDPNSAIAYCEEELRLRHNRVIAEVLRTWGRTDPQAALASGWLVGRTLDASGLNGEFVDPLVVGWFESGQPGLETWMETLDPASKAVALSAYMRMRILRDGGRPALEWAVSAPYAPDLQRLLVATGLNIVARQDPPLAIEWLDIAAQKGIDIRTFVARIGRGWASTQPREAIEWVVVREVENEMERWRAVGDITKIWLEKDEAAVEAWLQTKTGEPWTDVVRRQAIVEHVRQKKFRVDWLDMMGRASRFIDDEQRKMQYLWIIQRWKVIEPEAASKWLAENEALLGDKLEFVDQIPSDDFKKIQEILKSEQPTSPPAKN